MSEALAQHLIDHLLDVIDGELSGRTRVIDGLLDLRSATERADVIVRIDEILASVPGVTTVANVWWMATLEDLRALVGSPSLSAL